MRVYPYIVFITGFAHLMFVFFLVDNFSIQKTRSNKTSEISVQLVYEEKPEPIQDELVEFPEIKEIEIVEPEPQPEVIKPDLPKSKPKPKLIPQVIEKKIKTVVQKKQNQPVDLAQKQSQLDLRRLKLKKALGLKKEYDQLLKEYLEQHKRFPTLARRFNQEGIAKYKVRIEKDGTFSSIKRLESTGFESLDSESMKLIQSASGFKPIPRQFSYLNLTIPIEYSLQ